MTNAVGLLLCYCLELPSAPQRPELGFRRAQWMAHAAQRMGFKEEGIPRWMWVLPKEGNEIALRDGDTESEAGASQRDVTDEVVAVCR